LAEHHIAAAERVAANVAEAESQKGVRGTARPRPQGLDREAASRKKKGK